MANTYSAIIEKSGEWYIAYCPEVPGANGQGKTVEECKTNLSQAITLIIRDRIEDALRGAPSDALKDTVVVDEDKIAA